MHSNIGVYLEIAEQLSGVLKETSNKNDILREFNDGKTDEEKLTLDDLEKMQKIIKHVEGLCNDTKVALNIINGRIAQKSLLEQSEKSKATEEMRDFLALSQRTKGEGALINSITQTDVSWLEQNLFSQDSSTNAAVRALYSIVNDAVQRSNKKLAEKRQLLVELQDQLGANESVTDIYEKDNGITTGWIVRKLNFGKFYNKLDEKYVTLNKQFNDMFGKLEGYASLPEKNRVAPNNETIITEKQREELGLPKVEDYQYTIRTAYNECINQFKAANGHRRYKAEYAALYFQSFSNTFDSIENLRKVYDYALSLYDFKELIVSTRPDLLSDEVCKLLSSYQTKDREVWVEIGLQSGNDKTLKKINRGHDSKCFIAAVNRVKSYGLKVTAHLLLMPSYDSLKDIEDSVRIINETACDGIKIHNIHITHNTALEKSYINSGCFSTMSYKRHIALLAFIIARLNRDIIVFRLLTETPRARLVYPIDYPDKRDLIENLEKYMENNNITQGSLLPYPKSGVNR